MKDKDHSLISRVHGASAINWGGVNFFNASVAERTDLLTPQQKPKLLDLCLRIKSVDWLKDLKFEVRAAFVEHNKNTTFHVPTGMIQGYLPHCDLYGGIDAEGRIHT